MMWAQVVKIMNKNTLTAIFFVFLLSPFGTIFSQESDTNLKEKDYSAAFKGVGGGLLLFGFASGYEDYSYWTRKIHNAENKSKEFANFTLAQNQNTDLRNLSLLTYMRYQSSIQSLKYYREMSIRNEVYAIILGSGLITYNIIKISNTSQVAIFSSNYQSGFLFKHNF
jgi:hypothetical protein